MPRSTTSVSGCSLARGKFKVLEFTPQLIILCNEQKVFIHIVQCVQNCGIDPNRDRRVSLFNIPHCGSAHTGSFRDQFGRQMPP